MTAPKLVCNGRPLDVGAPIGRGGEGQVYAIDDGTGRAVKVYFDPTPERHAKVRAMVGSGIGDRCPNVAFPADTVHTVDGAFAGFTMRKVTASQPIHQLISSKSRLKHFPNADYRFLVRTAANAARCVANVHRAGVIIGDINSSGFLVSSTGLVTLIDADSFQFENFGCQVGMPEYTPPELQGASLAGVQRTTDHDMFGSAVLTFQMLMLGRHPYAGVMRGHSQAPDAAIARKQFAFSALRDTGTAPPPAAPSLQDLPRDVRLLFECAFGPCRNARPAANEWVHALDNLEKALVPCSDQQAHYIAVPGQSCPLCRIERTTGRPVFQPSFSRRPAAVSRLVVNRHDLDRGLIAKVKSHAKEDCLPKWHRYSARPSNEVRQLKADRGLTAGQIYLATGRVPFGPGYRLVERLATLSAQAKSSLNNWQNDLGIWEAHRLAELLHRNIVLYENVTKSKSRLLANGLAGEVSARAESILGTLDIAGANIAGIGHSTRSRLANHDIRTAADVSRPALSAIPGLGHERAFGLLIWRERALVDAERSLVNQEEFMRASANNVAAEFQRDLIRLIEIIDTISADLKQRVSSIQRSAQIPDHRLARVLAERDQAECDLFHLGVDPTEALKRLAYRPAISAAKNRPPVRVRPRAPRPRLKP